MIRLFGFLFHDPRINGRVLGATIFIHLLGLAPAFYVTLVFARYLAHGVDATLLTLTVGTMLAMLIERSLRNVRNDLLVALIAKQDRERATGVFERLVQAPMESLNALGFAERSQALRAVEQVQQVVTTTHVTHLLDAPFSLVFWLVLMLIAWPLGIAALLVTVATLLSVYFRAISLRETIKTMQKAQQSQQAMLASAERIETVRVANAGAFLNNRYNNRTGNTRLLRFDSAARQEGLQQVVQTASGVMTLFTIGLGAKLSTLGMIDLGALFGANILAVRMLTLAVRPAQSLGTLLQGAEALPLIEQIMALPVETSEGIRLTEFSGRFELKDVSFAYPNGQSPLFENVSLTILPGELLAVVGGNGTGKSSFSRLLAGLLTPTRGAMLVDGVDLRQVVPRWWRRQLIYLPQEPEFFDGTLLENMSTLSPKIPQEVLKNHINRVGLSDFIDHHPNGMAMQVQQGGRQFSPGIRRRLALVRAMTTQGKLVILDEPMEGLDATGSELVEKLIIALRQQGHTIVFCTQALPAFLRGQAKVLDLDIKPVPVIHHVGASHG